ncbi:MAG TPA: tetratricopeptide repeat protein [Verrucomicrobiae bacterium]|nr:tetratricopeptide repeat protein [Verrucomicrobiae bacterium]
MSFWRKEVIDFALDHDTRRQMEEQIDWIGREPANPKPYYHLAQFYRMNGRADEARGLLLEAVRLDAAFAEAHVSLAEMYAVAGEYKSAWHHAREAEKQGVVSAVELLNRYGIK